MVAMIKQPFVSAISIKKVIYDQGVLDVTLNNIWLMKSSKVKHISPADMCLTFSCSMFFLCCLIFFTSSGRSGIPFPASSSCSAAYNRQKAPVRPTPELRRTKHRMINNTKKLKWLWREEQNPLMDLVFSLSTCISMKQWFSGGIRDV